VLHIVPMSATAIRAGHRHGISSVATVYTRTPRSSRRLSQWVNERSERFLLRETDVLVFESSNTMRAFAPHAGRLILNGIDTEYFRPRVDLRRRVRHALGIPDDRFVVLFLGRMDRLKGIYLLLEALAILRRASSPLVCLLVGSIEVVDIPQRVAQLGIGDIVRVIGPVGKLEVLDYYCASDVFVLPSYLEGISSALIEAMACGLPVVATKVGGNPEVVRDKEDGVLIEPGKAEALATAIQRFQSDPSAIATLGRNARARIQERFSLDSMTDQYVRAYEEARANSPRTRQISRGGSQPA